MNPPGPPSQPSVIPTQNAQGQQTWIPGTQQNLNLGFASQSPPPGAQQAMGHMNIQQHNFSQVPQQIPGNAMTPPQPPPGRGDIPPPPSSTSQSGMVVPPLDRTRFQGSYRHFCTTKKLVINEPALSIRGKSIDLHVLHQEVLKLRATRVSFVLSAPSCPLRPMSQISQNFWHIIGAKLGFSFNEDQVSNDVANQVASIYKQYLHQFDTIYVASYLQETFKRNPQQGQTQSQNPAMHSQPPPTGPSAAVNQQPQQQRSSAVPQHPLQQTPQGPHMSFPGNPPYQFNQLIPYAFIPAAELRVHGINEQFIAHVEEKRPQLQRLVEQHQMRRQSTGGTVNNTPGLGMGLSSLPGTQSQQTQLQHQMMLNAPQQMNLNLRPGVPSGIQTSKANEGTGIGLHNVSVAGVNDGTQRTQIPQPPQMPTQNSLASAISNPNLLRGRPNQEQINNAAMFVQRTKKEYMTRSEPFPVYSTVSVELSIMSFF